MISPALAYFVLSPAWPSWMLALGVIAAAAIWLWSYGLVRLLAAEPAGGRPSLLGRLRQAGLVTGRVGLAFGGIWLGFQVTGRIFLLATSWSIWPVALIAACGAEAVIWLYRLERQIVPRRTGLLLTGLRLGLLGLVILMLIQPVFVSLWQEMRKRVLALLVDTSASMRISDRQLPPHEKLRLAETFSVGSARRPYHLEDNADSLRAVQAALVGELAWLDRLSQSKSDAIGEQLIARRKELHERFNAWGQVVAEQTAAVQSLLDEFKQLPKNLQADLQSAKATLSAHVRPGLVDAAARTHEDQVDRLAADFDRLRSDLHRAVKELANAAPLLEKVGQELDKSLYEQLSPSDRAAVEAVAGLSRLELAKATLLHRPTLPDKDEQDESLLARLAEQYNLKVYTFAGELAEADAKGWSDPIPSADANVATAPAGNSGTAKSDDPAIQRTDLAAAMGKALAEVGGDQLAAMVVLSEGQDNGNLKAEPVARQLGGQGSAMWGILMGAEKPPTDAAIIAIEAPDTVYLADRMFIDAELKLDGLAGKEVRATLYDGDRPVDFKTIRVAGDVYRTHIQLADEPKKVGLHSYRLELSKHPDEVFTDNNSYALTLSVTDDKTKVLLVDSRPRWEFRYLKNLFTGRDKTVTLQYVLLRPDQFYGQPPRPKAHASVSRRARGQEEATLLPKDEAEWLKFDVIFLGEVSQKDLSAEDMDALRRFVSDRGGTLILIAGKESMPGDLAGTPLAELVPVELSAPPAAAARLPRQGFRIALTPEGEDHVILRQDVEPDKSSRIWESLPPLFWRSPFVQAKKTATVLAYALDSGAPQWLTGKPPPPATLPEDIAQRREEFRRSRALIAVAPHGLGKVMMLSFDRTWRLRYRMGDTYHHKFWGQVLRWATAGKLPAGTDLVKLGSDKTRYAPRARPVVRAKILQEDHAPMTQASAAVKVFAGDKLIGRVPMKYVPDSPGIYTATLEELPAGAYRLELDCPEAQALLQRDGVEKLSVEISVDPASPAEQIELAANPNLLGRLAGLSHEGGLLRPYKARRLLESLPPGKVEQTHRRQFALWDSWVLFGLFCAAATAEWLLRKRVGLA